MSTAAAALPFGDTADLDAAERGFIAAGESVIRNDRGEAVWDNGSYTDFLTGDAPDTVHPSLWRQPCSAWRFGFLVSCARNPVKI
jgi:alkyl sulfatase BDS1-like metallo-beta-lactamase superfamily hydrolase